MFFCPNSEVRKNKRKMHYSHLWNKKFAVLQIKFGIQENLFFNLSLCVSKIFAWFPNLISKSVILIVFFNKFFWVIKQDLIHLSINHQVVWCFCFTKCFEVFVGTLVLSRLMGTLYTLKHFNFYKHLDFYILKVHKILNFFN